MVFQLNGVPGVVSTSPDLVPYTKIGTRFDFWDSYRSRTPKFPLYVGVKSAHRGMCHRDLFSIVNNVIKEPNTKRP